MSNEKQTASTQEQVKNEQTQETPKAENVHTEKQPVKVNLFKKVGNTAGTAFLAGLFGVVGAWVANVSIHAGVDYYKHRG